MNNILAIDFDGTLELSDNYPHIGDPNIPVIEHVIRFKRAGWHLVLWTCRANDKLQAAVDFCREHGITFDKDYDAINDNIPEIKKCGINCRKVVATYYLDNRSANIEHFLSMSPEQMDAKYGYHGGMK